VLYEINGPAVSRPVYFTICVSALQTDHRFLSLANVKNSLLSPRLLRISPSSADVTISSPCVWMAATFHAQVAALNHYADRQWLHMLHQRFCDLYGQAFLYQQTARKAIDQARKFGNADNFAV
jgi:hypothetical protein